MELRVKSGLPERAEYFKLFDSTGWNHEYNLSPWLLHQSLHNSWYMISVRNGKSLIGFGRVLSDGVLHAFIVDLMVLPDYQRCGVGKLILSKLVDKCKLAGIPDIQLFCANGKKEFYTKQGFRPRPDGAPGMELSK